MPAFDRPSLAAEVLVQIRAAPSEWHRSRALRGVARHLSQEQVTEAGGIAEQLTVPEWRAAAQAALAAQARGAGRSDLLGDGLETARRIVTPGGRAWAMLLVVGAMLPQERAGIRQEVFTAIDEAEDPAVVALLLPDEWVEEAAARAEAIPSSWMRAETLASLIVRMALGSRQGWTHKALDSAREAPDPGGKGRGFASLVGGSDASERENLVQLALPEAARAADEGTRAIVLTELARFLSDEQREWAWGMAAAMGRAELRVPLLAMLDGFAQGPRKQERVRAVWTDLATTDDEWAKCVALMRLWPHLPPDLRDQAQATAGSIRDPWARADLLAFLSARTPPPDNGILLDQSIASARSAPSPWARSRALTAILHRVEE